MADNFAATQHVSIMLWLGAWMPTKATLATRWDFLTVPPQSQLMFASNPVHRNLSK